MKNISVIGMGHVGLITLCCLAKQSHDVIGTDTDEKKLATLRSGECPLYEPGLSDLLFEGMQKGSISFAADVGEAVRKTDIVFICVGTPPGRDCSVDLSQIQEVSRVIGSNLNNYKVIVEKSTVPVNTANFIKRTVQNNLKPGFEDIKFDVVSNPEFLREGQAVQDFFHPERIVIGTENETAQEWMRELYSPFSCPIIFTDIATSELIKYACNSFLATKISFINLVANMCEKVAADVKMVAAAMGLDSRIGNSFLHAGIGYGGSCLPKDIKAFADMLESHEIDSGLLNEVIKINDQRIGHIIEKAMKHIGNFCEKRVLVLGLAFKKDTDDIRESQSIRLIEALLAQKSVITCYDPRALDNARNYFSPCDHKLTFCEDIYKAFTEIDIAFIMTDLDEICSIDFDVVKQKSGEVVIIDGKNLLDGSYVRSFGLRYEAIGSA